MDISKLQDRVREVWTAETYHETVINAAGAGLPIMASHAALHIAKAAGKVAAALEPADHGGPIDRAALTMALADLVICAAKVANEAPHPIGLDQVVRARLEQIAQRQSAADHQH